MKKLLLVFVLFLLFPFSLNADNNIFGVELPLDYVSVNKSATAPDKLKLSHSNGEKLESTRIYLKFDMSPIPENVSIIDAKLSFGTSQCIGDKLELSIGRITSDWDKKEIKWENKPGFSSPTSTASFDCNNDIVFWDISELIKNIYSDQSENYGLVVFGPDEVGTGDFSREFNAESKETYLLVDYEVIEDTPEPTVTNKSNKSTLLISLIVVALIVIVILVYLIFILIKKKSSYAKASEDKNDKELKDEPRMAKDGNFENNMTESVKNEKIEETKVTPE